MAWYQHLVCIHNYTRFCFLFLIVLRSVTLSGWLWLFFHTGAIMIYSLFKYCIRLSANSYLETERNWVDKSSILSFYIYLKLLCEFYRWGKLLGVSILLCPVLRYLHNYFTVGIYCVHCGNILYLYIHTRPYSTIYGYSHSMNY